MSRTLQPTDRPGAILRAIARAYPNNRKVADAFYSAFTDGAGQKFEGKPHPDIWRFLKDVGGEIDDPGLKSLLLKGAEISDAIELCRSEPRDPSKSAKLRSLQGHARSISGMIEVDERGRLVRHTGDEEERMGALKSAIV